jgi:N-dimethylarginine dimethylaminohydrolase
LPLNYVRTLQVHDRAKSGLPNLLRFEGPDSEFGLLKEVLLASPRNLSIVPGNRVSEDALHMGQNSCSISASRQHRALVETLVKAGVRVRTVQPVDGLPDLAFTRDTSLMTPWGLIGLRPGIAHRRDEVDVVLVAARAAGVPILGRVETGAVEGGDVCLLKPGHLVIGVSEVRTTEEGAKALSSFFELRGWTVTRTPVDPELLHLDTHFCVLDHGLALACEEKLDPAFLTHVKELGIRIVPVRADEIGTLGCNVLSLGGRRIVSSGSAPRVDEAVRGLGFEVLTVPLSEFTQCGGGVHCLTMPLRRQTA